MGVSGDETLEGIGSLAGVYASEREVNEEIIVARSARRAGEDGARVMSLPSASGGEDLGGEVVDTWSVVSDPAGELSAKASSSFCKNGFSPASTVGDSSTLMLLLMRTTGDV